MAEKTVFWLHELGKEHNLLVGRKCANLGEMQRLGLKVPAGFALSIAAYADILNSTGAAQEVKDLLRRLGAAQIRLDQLGQVSREIRRIVESKKMPEHLAAIVRQYYQQLGEKCGTANAAVATRSAGPASRPGQYETYLNVSGEAEVLEHIIKVWASTFNAQSLAYRQQKKLPLEHDPIGVAVLQMVRARSAGVAFTADPNTGDSSRVTIEANWGIGESVVNGSAAPDVFVIEKASLEIKEQTLGLKSKCIVTDARGVKEIQAPAEKRSAYCLSDDEAKNIARLACRLEEHFQAPQDIEWAIEENGGPVEGLFLLQSRAEVIVETKTDVDQIVDIMLSRFPGGQP